MNSSRSRAERKGMSATQRANRIQPANLENLRRSDNLKQNAISDPVSSF